MKSSKEIKIGLIVLSGILLLYWGINYLKGKDVFSNQKQVYAVYDRVDGLAASNLVMVNGFKIGLIHSISLLPDHSGKIIVTMNIDNNLKIPRNSVAQIFSTDLLGTKGIRLEFGTSAEDVQNGDTLISDIQKSLTDEVSEQVAPIKRKAENLLASLDSVTAIIQEVFNKQTKENLKRSFGSIASSLSSIEHITMNFDSLMTRQNGKLKIIFNNVESITTNLKNNNEKISNAIDNFSAISDTLRKSNLAGTIESTRKTLEETARLFEKINKGEGTLGMLINNDSLYLNLNSSARSLDTLLQDINAHPKKYVHFSVFGKGK